MSQPANFGFGSEEQMVRDAAAKFLKDTLPVDRLRALVAGNHVDAYESDVQPVAWDEGHWARCVELGWTALAVPETAGGAELPWIAVATLAEEAGRAALPSPLQSTLAATAVLRAALNCGCSTGTRALERIASGTAAALATSGVTGDWDCDGVDVCATEHNGSIKLSGSAYFVQDARKVAFFVVAANEGDGIGLFIVAADAPGLTIVPDRITDLTRDQAVVRFDSVETEAGARVATADTGARVLAAATPAILTVLAADMVGAAEWQLQTTAEYARVRKQFGHEIGFFQAVKHPIVNMMIDIDRARSLVYAAACAQDKDPTNAARLAHMAKAAASDMAAFCASRSVQLHGGIGFTWECDVHIWFKRQKHSQMLYGDGAWHRAKLAEFY